MINNISINVNTDEETHVANKPIKQYLSFCNQGKANSTRMKYHFISIYMGKNRKADNTKWKGCGVAGSHIFRVGA